MRGKKEFKDPSRLTLQLEKEYLEYLKQTAIQISAQKCKLITATELIRQAIEQVYPMSKEETDSNCTHKTGTDH
jgi:hypothetical protein